MHVNHEAFFAHDGVSHGPTRDMVLVCTDRVTLYPIAYLHDKPKNPEELSLMLFNEERLCFHAER